MVTTQADGRFLHGILLVLILAAVASGAMAAIPMVKAEGTRASIVSQP